MTDEELWLGKVNEAAQRVRELIATDARTHVMKAARDAYVESEDLPMEGASALKATAKAQGETLAANLRTSMTAQIWLTGSPENTNAPLLEHPATPALIERIDAFTRHFFAAEQLGDAPGYQLPARFIDGQNLASLTRELWKALHHLTEARAQRSARQRADEIAARRRLWDQV